MICPYKTSLLWICLLISLGELQAQRFGAALLAGLNASQVDGDDLAGFDRLGLTGGIRASMLFDSPFQLNIEFLYSERGSQPDLFNPEYDPDLEIALRYAEIPVYVSIGDWWQEEGEYYKMSAIAGLSYGRLISARTFDYVNPDESNLDKYVPFFNDHDLSWLLGAQYRMNPRWAISGRYTRELIPLFEPQKHGFDTRRLLSYWLTFRLEYIIK